MCSIGAPQLGQLFSSVSSACLSGGVTFFDMVFATNRVWRCGAGPEIYHPSPPGQSLLKVS